MKWVATGIALPDSSGSLLADVPEQLPERYARLAREEDPAFSGFSVERGHEPYLQKRVLPIVGAINRASCHMADLREEVIAHKSKVLCQCDVINDSEHSHPKDAKLRKIPPLAPSANPERLTDFDHVEAFLKPNCEMVFGRVCSAREKGDILTWINSIH